MKSVFNIPNSIFAPALRFAGYIFIVLAVVGLITLDAYNTNVKPFSEASWTEMSQLTVLFFCAAICLFMSYKYFFRRSAFLLAAFFAASFIREMDGFLDQWLGHGSWVYFVAPLVIAALWFTWRHRSEFFNELKLFLPSVAGGFFSCGFLTTYIFSRFFGRKFLWRSLMGEEYLRSVKMAAEESVELLGYAFLLFAVIELCVLAKNITVRRAGN
ncbi:MAG: hypothetical protein WC959_11740 [Kiritimatiellales bacterium]